MSKNVQHIAALDIGTTKVAVAIAVRCENGFKVIGWGQAPSWGMKQGAVVNIEATAQAICKACEEAESMAGTAIRSVWLGMGGTGVSSFKSSGMVAIRHRQVTPDDVKRVIEVARSVLIPNDRRILHVLPTNYTIDNQGGICDPIGLSGVRLEAGVQIITGPQAVIQNALRCTEKAGLKVSGLALQSLASSMAVLSEDEKSMGVTVVDIGGGTCDLVTYHQGSVVYTGVIPLGGRNFTNDVALGLRTTQVHAEDLKKQWGCVLPDRVTEEETIESSRVEGSVCTISRKDLCTILEARSEEVLSLIRDELQSAEVMNQLGAGVVVTGGASHLQGFVELADFLFDIPVRQGFPSGSGELMETLKEGHFATVVGLLAYGVQELERSRSFLWTQGKGFSKKWAYMNTRVKNYLSGLF